MYPAFQLHEFFLRWAVFGASSAPAGRPYRAAQDRLAAMEKLMLASADQQISLTDPDSRSMTTSGRGSGVVGYSVQVAVDTEHHLMIAHEVRNSGSYQAATRRHRLRGEESPDVDELEAVADRAITAAKTSY